MGFYVHVQISFSVHSVPAMARLASEHRARLDEGKERDAVRILLAMEEGERYVGHGPKGSLFCFGFVGNYSNGESIAEALAPMIEQMLREDEAASDFDHVVLLVEPEQTESAQAFEMYLVAPDASTPSRYGKLTTRHHDGLPFCWGQM